MIARGMTNPDIAAELFLSAHTVKSHINRIFAKTGSRRPRRRHPLRPRPRPRMTVRTS